MTFDSIKAYIVHAFTKDNSGGSPTGVVFNPKYVKEEQLQFIASQLPVSHTAFVYEPINENENVKVRFFTTKGEILNCGHGTIAAHYTRAMLLNISEGQRYFQEAKEGMQQIELVNESGSLQVYLKANEIQFLSPPQTSIKSLLDALGINETAIAEYYPLVLASPGSYRFLLAVVSAEKVNGINPDFDKLQKACNKNKSIGCFVYAIDDPSLNPSVTARMFAPNIGVNEDIINGNSSACLGAYLLQLGASNKIDLLINQGHKFSCDGLVRVRSTKENGHIETLIGGTARIEKEVVLMLHERKGN